jgi:hypothetical protein
MAYELKIERDGDAEITLEEWHAAVEAVSGIRICLGEQHASINPLSGAIMSMPVEPGDVEIHDPSTGRWEFCVRWYGGTPTFNARVIERALDGDLSDPAWLALRSVANNLNAAIVGEEGELYGEDGKMIIG